ncbi:MAG: 5'-nucleotidase C-terminal domain-containing protein, partial [Prevotella sp.]|nr:5'-nucleotidase C-terminal domain-containing protein [Prevotella sp.]
RDGVKIAILGMLTPAIPNWLKEPIWSGMHFEEMVSCAKYWVGELQKTEHPDVIVGLFHSGWEGGIKTSAYDEDASRLVAEQVPGFDLILFGHDHTPHVEILSHSQQAIRPQRHIPNANPQTVLCLDPANNAVRVADATIEVILKGKRIISKNVSGELVDVRNLPIDEEYMKHFQSQIEKVKAWANREIGTFKQSIYTRDSYFGSSAFNDFILNLQLQITGADIAFNAPLSFDAAIKEGPVTVADMFNLYKFENQLYVMRLTGEEIRKHLEMSYDLWVNTMKSPEDHLLLLNERTYNDSQRMGFKNFSFNFDSAAGIDYEVDVTKPDGEKVRILRMSNGEPFDETKWYKVAINSYRGNGGGELLTRGAGIPQEELQNRIVWESERDQRWYLMEEIERQQVLNPQPNNNWRFVPEDWVKPAAERDRKLLFNE